MLVSVKKGWSGVVQMAAAHVDGVAARGGVGVHPPGSPHSWVKRRGLISWRALHTAQKKGKGLATASQRAWRGMVQRGKGAESHSREGMGLHWPAHIIQHGTVGGGALLLPCSMRGGGTMPRRQGGRCLQKGLNPLWIYSREA